MARKISYSKYLRAKNFIGFNSGIDISNALANTMKNSVRRATIQNASDLVSGSLIGGVAGAFGSVGKSPFIYLKQIDRRLDSKILTDRRVQDVMNLILIDAQEITPVDKKYIGKKGKSLKVNMKLPMFKDLKEREEGRITAGVVHGGFRDYSVLSGRNLRNYQEIKKINFLSGRYSIEKQKQIKKDFYSDDRSQARNLWFNESDQSINLYSAKKKSNKRIATAFNESGHYGEEELKRSGKYNEKEGIISFNPQRLGADYNYAALQHDRLDFKHKGKGQALFLYKAYVKHRRDLIATIDEVTQEKLANLLSKREPQRRFNPATDIPVANKNIAKRNITKSTQNMKRALREMAKFK